ncbi:TPA: NlpC/P60 family protein [Salmonella enterica subsp. enterica serovar Waycross]
MLGKPYADRCCHVDTVDCWGLIVMYYRLCHGVNVHHDDSYDNGGSFSTCFDGEVQFWRDTDSPSIGDVVVAYRGNTPIHVALWWGRDKILHAREKTAVRFDRLLTLERLSTKLRFLTYASHSRPEDAGIT